ncbi:hypothetical protein VFPPC_05632 [Pochonia chlamydosporia 170]|uniref:Uncharacterized protein n=1 Tax=Pochonia chlamydosporia 170 TaxID=1380566 RepID=A0A179FGE0_METCM|nr:hypothetical protein VFPPC_05632 [Pochonia chlamydosporia 170]OAQ64350.1 hypothetical protein VFPPC_05632 [Pochonia chlamydosporia 170]
MGIPAKSKAERRPSKPRPSALYLDNLPVEIQRHIYKFALVEAPRWDKLHDLPCEYKPSTVGPLEPPPFLHVYIKVSEEADKPWTVNSTTKCDCAKRKGIALLQTNTRINRIASSVFWSLNTFCFLDAAEFVATVGTALRPECRAMIRFVSIMSPSSYERPSQVFFRPLKSHTELAPRFWDLVAECRSLRKLEVPVAYFEHFKSNPEQLSQLKEKLPALPEIGMTRLMVFCRERYPYSALWRICCCEYEDFVTYARCARPFTLRDMSWDTESITEMLRDTELNFCVHVDTAIKVQFLGADIDDLASWLDTLCLAPGIREGSRRRRIKLPSGKVTTVTFYSLPMSEKSRIKKTRFIMERDRRQKSLNGLTHAQNEAQEDFRNNRRWANEMENEREAERQKEVELQKIAQREERRLEIRTMEEEAEREAVRLSKALGQKEMRQIRRDRKRGRKKG